MPTHAEHKLVPYTPEQMFDLVADVGRYHEFLPWCAASRVRTATPEELVADLTIGFGPVPRKLHQPRGAGPGRTRRGCNTRTARSGI